MPKINVYLPKELAQAVKEAGIPVSAVCQRALRQAVERATAAHEAASAHLAATELSTHLDSDLLVSAIGAATALARSGRARTVGTGHLLSVLLADGDSRVTAVLDAIGVYPDEVVREVARQSADEPGLPGVEPGERLSVPASEAVAFAVAEAQASDGDDIGPEHLLLGLIAEQDGVASKVLRAQGAKLSAARQVVTGLARATDARRPSGGSLDAVVNEFAEALVAAVNEKVEPLIDRVDRLEWRMAANFLDASPRPRR
ncbi:type II toxin-antitoxin system CcdA family antitoxin [Actinoallomurus spadix]|nr:Clp protease N-terminal domain-containing protein [Actinoallomurus spadix]MCO5989139.1 type II toxin-antitoxin system CcdA family antitoxin [Actinoallomurus spadix]